VLQRLSLNLSRLTAA